MGSIFILDYFLPDSGDETILQFLPIDYQENEWKLKDKVTKTLNFRLRNANETQSWFKPIEFYLRNWK